MDHPFGGPGQLHGHVAQVGRGELQFHLLGTLLQRLGDGLGGLGVKVLGGGVQRGGVAHLHRGVFHLAEEGLLGGRGGLGLGDLGLCLGLLDRGGSAAAALTLAGVGLLAVVGLGGLDHCLLGLLLALGGLDRGLGLRLGVLGGDLGGLGLGGHSLLGLAGLGAGLHGGLGRLDGGLRGGLDSCQEHALHGTLLLDGQLLCAHHRLLQGQHQHGGQGLGGLDVGLLGGEAGLVLGGLALVGLLLGHLVLLVLQHTLEVRGVPAALVRGALGTADLLGGDALQLAAHLEEHLRGCHSFTSFHGGCYLPQPGSHCRRRCDPAGGNQLVNELFLLLLHGLAIAVQLLFPELFQAGGLLAGGHHLLAFLLCRLLQFSQALGLGFDLLLQHPQAHLVGLGLGDGHALPLFLAEEGVQVLVPPDQLGNHLLLVGHLLEQGGVLGAQAVQHLLLVA